MPYRGPALVRPAPLSAATRAGSWGSHGPEAVLVRAFTAHLSPCRTAVVLATRVHHCPLVRQRARGVLVVLSDRVAQPGRGTFAPISRPSGPWTLTREARPSDGGARRLTAEGSLGLARESFGSPPVGYRGPGVPAAAFVIGTIRPGLSAVNPQCLDSWSRVVPGPCLQRTWV